MRHTILGLILRSSSNITLISHGQLTVQYLIAQVEKYVTCKKESKNDALQCPWCSKRERRICAELIQSKYNILGGL